MPTPINYDFVRFGQVLVCYIGSEWSDETLNSYVDSMRNQPDEFFQQPWATLFIDVGFAVPPEIGEAIAANSFWALEHGLAARAVVFHEENLLTLGTVTANASKVPSQAFANVEAALNWLKMQGIDSDRPI